MRSSAKVVPLDVLEERVRQLREQRKTVALANGLFDILHVGHLRYLEAASERADALVVAVNSDSSARRLKGPSRPVVPARERAELVAGFSCVSWVTIFDEATVEHLLERCRPTVHCKGTDYTAETVPEADTARRLGIRVEIVGDPKQHATRDLIRRLREA